MPHPLVADWIGYHAEKAKASDPRFSAFEKLNELIREDPETAWSGPTWCCSGRSSFLASLGRTLAAEHTTLAA